MTVYVDDGVKEIELKQLQKTLSLNKATKKVNYVAKEEASQRHANEIGEDFLSFFQYIVPIILWPKDLKSPRGPP